MGKTAYEIRLDLVTEARLILQAQATTADDMPSTEDVLAKAEELNVFVSDDQGNSSGNNNNHNNRRRY